MPAEGSRASDARVGVTIIAIAVLSDDLTRAAILITALLLIEACVRQWQSRHEATRTATGEEDPSLPGEAAVHMNVFTLRFDDAELEHTFNKRRFVQSEPVLLAFCSVQILMGITCLLYTSPSPRD